LPPRRNSDGDLPTDFARGLAESSFLHSSSSSSMPPFESMSMERATEERREDRALTAMSPARRLWAVVKVGKDLDD